MGKMKLKKPRKITPKKDLAYLFWEKYDKADLLEREKLLAPILKNMMTIYDLKDRKLRKHVLRTALQSYFDDMLEYMYSREK